MVRPRWAPVKGTRSGRPGPVRTALGTGLAGRAGTRGRV